MLESDDVVAMSKNLWGLETRVVDRKSTLPEEGSTVGLKNTLCCIHGLQNRSTSAQEQIKRACLRRKHVLLAPQSWLLYFSSLELLCLKPPL